MSLLGTITGGALGAVGSIFGGIKASKAMKQVKKDITGQQADNLGWYNRRYNEDATARADARRVLENTARVLRERNRAAQGQAAVAGGTQEAVAAEKAAAAEAMADATSQIAARAESRKDNIESVYQQRDAAMHDALNNLQTKKSQAITTAIGGVADAGQGIAKAL